MKLRSGIEKKSTQTPNANQELKFFLSSQKITKDPLDEPVSQFMMDMTGRKPKVELLHKI